MDDDPDAMWKPGYVAPAAATRPARPRWRGVVPLRTLRRLLGAGVAVAVAAAVAGGSAFGVRRLTDAAASSSPVAREAAVSPERLPRAALPMWSTVLDRSGYATARGVTAGEGIVTAVVDHDVDRSSIVAVDLQVGAVRWRHNLDQRTGDLTVVGIIDGAVVVHNGAQLVALSVDDGAPRWTADVDPAVDVVLLAHTAVLTEIGAEPDELTFRDPAGGRALGRIDGRLAGHDRAGTWFVSAYDRLWKVDLSSGFAPPVGVMAWESTSVAEFDDGVVAVSGGRLVHAGSDARPGPSITATDGSPLPDVGSVLAVGDGHLVGIGKGVVFGGELVADGVRIEWQYEASLRDMAETDRGAALVLSDAGTGFIDGADLLVIDAVSGRRIAATGPAPSADDLPRVLRDGVLVARRATHREERIGYDLAGVELWRVMTVGPTQLADGVLVTLAKTPNGYVLRGFGEL